MQADYSTDTRKARQGLLQDSCGATSVPVTRPFHGPRVRCIFCTAGASGLHMVGVAFVRWVVSVIWPLSILYLITTTLYGVKSTPYRHYTSLLWRRRSYLPVYPVEDQTKSWLTYSVHPLSERIPGIDRSPGAGDWLAGPRTGPPEDVA